MNGWGRRVLGAVVLGLVASLVPALPASAKHATGQPYMRVGPVTGWNISDQVLVNGPDFAHVGTATGSLTYKIKLAQSGQEIVWHACYSQTTGAFNGFRQWALTNISTANTYNRSTNSNTTGGNGDCWVHAIMVSNGGVTAGDHDYEKYAASNRVMALWQTSGFVAKPSAPIHSPYYKCGRTIRDVGGGQYFVDLEAANGAPGYEGKEYEDKNMQWSLSWNGGTVATPEAWQGSSRTTLALPSLDLMPPGGWTATFRVDRESGFLISVDNVDKFVEMRTDEDGPGPVPELPWWVAPPVRDTFARLPTSWKYRAFESKWGHHWLPSQALVYRDDGRNVVPPTSGKAVAVTGTCTVTINPFEAEAPGRSTTAPPPPGHVDAATYDPGQPGGPAAPGQGEDGTKVDCSAGFLGRIPVIGGAFDLVARLVCTLKQLLYELFVPDSWGDLVDLGAYGDRFPVSWVGEGVGAVGDLSESVRRGSGGSACGPVMDLPAPMNKRFAFPGPGGCGGSGSSVGSADGPAYELFGFRGALRAALTVFLYLAVLWRLLRLAPWHGGKDDGGPVFTT